MDQNGIQDFTHDLSNDELVITLNADFLTTGTYYVKYGFEATYQFDLTNTDG